MNNRSRISLCKSLHRNPFRTKPHISLSQLPSQLGPDSAPPVSSKYNFAFKPASIPRIFTNPDGWNAGTRFVSGETRRQIGTYSSGDSVDVTKEVDKINLKFAEAREEIEMAMESKETVYFDEEAECAREAVKEVVEMFEGLLEKLPEREKGAVQRSMGLKIEQLKAEIQQLND